MHSAYFHMHYVRFFILWVLVWRWLVGGGWGTVQQWGGTR